MVHFARLDRPRKRITNDAVPSRLAFGKRRSQPVLQNHARFVESQNVTRSSRTGETAVALMDQDLAIPPGCHNDRLEHEGTATVPADDVKFQEIVNDFLDMPGIGEIDQSPAEGARGLKNDRRAHGLALLVDRVEPPVVEEVALCTARLVAHRSKSQLGDAALDFVCGNVKRIAGIDSRHALEAPRMPLLDFGKQVVVRGASGTAVLTATSAGIAP